MKTLVQEFKDKKNQNRVRVRANENGNILSSSTQGYSNKSDMVRSLIRSSIALLQKYAPHLLKHN